MFSPESIQHKDRRTKKEMFSQNKSTSNVILVGVGCSDSWSKQGKRLLANCSRTNNKQPIENGNLIVKEINKRNEYIKEMCFFFFFYYCYYFSLYPLRLQRQLKRPFNSLVVSRGERSRQSIASKTTRRQAKVMCVTQRVSESVVVLLLVSINMLSVCFAS
jgi:hypothetical protein